MEAGGNSIPERAGGCLLACLTRQVWLEVASSRPWQGALPPASSGGSLNTRPHGPADLTCRTALSV